MIAVCDCRRLRDDACQHDPLGQGGVLPIRDDHVGLTALGEGAEVHVHEGLAPAGPVDDLRHFLRVRVALQVVARKDNLVVHEELERV